LLTATFKDLHIENSKNYKRWYYSAAHWHMVTCDAGNITSDLGSRHLILLSAAFLWSFLVQVTSKL